MQDREVKHPNDMTREELRDLVWSMSSMALDLAQHLNWTNDCLKIQYRKEAYKRAEEMAYEITRAWEYEQLEGNMDIAVFGSNGLTSIHGDISQLVDSTLPIPVQEEPDKDSINYEDFDELYMELEEGVPWLEDILERQQDFKYIQGLADEHVGRDHVDIKVKTLRKAIAPFGWILDLAKASRKMLDMIKNESKTVA